MSDAADRIHEFRLSKGLTQDEFAEKCGLSRSTVARYEAGVVTPSFDTLQRMAKVFGISSDYFIGNEHTQKKIEDDDIKFALFGDPHHITDEQFEEVKRFARYVEEHYHKKEPK